jgi:hypothetical protein
MTEAERLKLAAIDEEDLAVISAHVQDAVQRVGDLVYLPRERRFAAGMNRFLWEQAEDTPRQDFERRRAALTFDRVRGVQTSQIDRADAEAVLELLAIGFEPAEPPAGHVLLVFAGGGAVRVEVECIEARLADLGPAWPTKAKPSHDLASGETKPGA